MKTGRNASPIVCVCKNGFVNSGPNGGTILEEGFSCISSLEAENVEVTSDSIRFHILETTADEYTETKLMKRANENDVEITLTSSKLNQTNSGTIMFYTLSQLEPGIRYTITLSNKNNSGKEYSFPAVTTCSCSNNDSIDRTGRPKDLNATQENGHVMFTFIDNSKCEEAFSITRSDHAEEFLADVSEYGVAFTRDYFFIGGKDCGFTINTGTEASDDLQYSKLPIGKLYMYCVRAVHNTHYMDHPLDYEGAGRQLQSSDDTCAPHKIRWEASIHSKITTEPNAGSLPIEDVEVTWELLRSDSDTTPIGCNECSGSSSTTEGGIFDIIINIDDAFFKYKNEMDFPVKIRFSKMSGTIDHTFLCNDGEDDCSGDKGTVVYLKHLQFKEPLHVYDETSIPFSGKVFIADTIHSGAEGCMLSNVGVCLIQERNIGSGTKRNDTMVCGDTGPDGTYSLPVIIGSTIDHVDLNYHEHAFRPSSESSFEGSIVIKENVSYENNDFEDVEKARVFVEIAGGLCDKQLGISELHMQIQGCDWNKYDPPQLPTMWLHKQTNVKELYQSVPAHLLAFRVLKVTDSENKEIIDKISEFFLGRGVANIDLKDTNSARKALELAEESQNNIANRGNKEQNEVKNKAWKNLKIMEEEEEEIAETVRFQYDGELTMRVEISNDQLECIDYNLVDDFGGEDSLHVLDYMTGFAVTVKPQYEIIKNEIYCDILHDDLKLHVVNQVGIDSNEGFAEFLEKMRAKDEHGANLLEKCRDTGCTFDIHHDKDEDGKKTGGAIVRELFATGRPNIAPPNAKEMIFSFQGRPNDATHTAAIIVGGYFSKGPGHSFALPTHKPIMVLRDPPGGLSYATYENVKTTIAIETSSTKTTIHNHFGLDFSTTVDLAVNMCFGLGASKCEELFRFSEDVKVFGTEDDIGGTVQLSEETRSTQFTTTWSYETSSDPWTAGAMSDVFVVPNLNVMYKEVYVVKWSNETCAVEKGDDGTLPITTTINLEDVENQPSLAFFSRYHVEYVKLPELKVSVDNIEAMRTDCNCTKQDPDLMCPFGNNEEASCGALDQQVASLNNATKEWTEYMLPKDDYRSNTIVNWFEKVGLELMKDENDLKIDDHPAALAPPTLLSGAKEVENMPKKPNEEDTKLDEIKRIQFSGGGSTFSMILSKEKMWDDVGLSCWHGCNTENEITVKAPGLDYSKVLGVGVGPKTELSILNLKTHVIHESTKEKTDTESTSIGFTLGDNDPGDEFVVDLYYDEKFGTVIFHSVAGRSKCPHELGTSAVEDPQLEITAYPSENIFPDEDMIFELEMSNKGVGNETQFALYLQQRDNLGGLKFFLDGAPFGGSRDPYTNVLKDKTYKKTLVVEKGPRMFEYPPIDIVLESDCEDTSSL